MFAPVCVHLCVARQLLVGLKFPGALSNSEYRSLLFSQMCTSSSTFPFTPSHTYSQDPLVFTLTQTQQMDVNNGVVLAVKLKS